MLFKTRKTVPPKMGKQPEIVKTDLKGFVAQKIPRAPYIYHLLYNLPEYNSSISSISIPFDPLTKKNHTGGAQLPSTNPDFGGFGWGGFTSCYGGPATAGWYGRSDGSEVHAVAHVRFDLRDLHPLESLWIEAFGWMMRWFLQRWDPADRGIKVG